MGCIFQTREDVKVSASNQKIFIPVMKSSSAISACPCNCASCWKVLVFFSVTPAKFLYLHKSSLLGKSGFLGNRQRKGNQIDFENTTLLEIAGYVGIDGKDLPDEHAFLVGW